jgi:hypothetical protein
MERRSEGFHIFDEFGVDRMHVDRLVELVTLRKECNREHEVHRFAPAQRFTDTAFILIADPREAKFVSEDVAEDNAHRLPVPNVIFSQHAFGHELLQYVEIGLVAFETTDADVPTQQILDLPG